MSVANLDILLKSVSPSVKEEKMMTEEDHQIEETGIETESGIEIGMMTEGDRLLETRIETDREKKIVVVVLALAALLAAQAIGALRSETRDVRRPPGAHLMRPLPLIQAVCLGSLV